MGRPTINIEGKLFIMPKPKGGAWRKLMAYDKNNREVFSEDFIEKRCEFLAEAFGGGLTADYLLDNLYLDEITLAYREVTSYMLGEITPKLEEAEKNVSEGDATEQ